MDPTLPLVVDRLDHLVLTVRDIDATIAFYEGALGMHAVSFGNGRRAIAFGHSKINLHPADAPFEPHAARPTPGSADLCFITAARIEAAVTRMQQLGIAIEAGPVERTGARGPLRSIYVRDPDGNLIEIANEAV